MLYERKVFKGNAIDSKKDLIELAIIEALLSLYHSQQKDEEERIIMNKPLLF